MPQPCHTTSGVVEPASAGGWGGGSGGVHQRWWPDQPFTSTSASWPLPALSDANDGPVTTLGEPRKVELPAGSPLRFVRMKIGLLP